MRMMNAVFVAILLSLVAGCSGQKFREGMYQGVYEGARIENTRGSTPAENVGKPEMSYDQYKRQREERQKQE